jgi:hypothetical protein
MGLPIGTVVVAAAGTAEQVVASGNAVSAVSFKARLANAGAVYVGDDAVVAATGFELQPGDEITLSFREAVDLRRFYVDAANNNDSLDYAGVSS